MANQDSQNGRKGGLFRAVAAVWRLYRDPAVPGWAKAGVIALAVLYLVSFIDLVPDVFFPIGFIDDAIIVPLILSLIRWFAPTGRANDPTQTQRKHVDSRRTDR
jgi:uncharacterized membrane protein YkvA (DUF1232 family)